MFSSVNKVGKSRNNREAALIALISKLRIPASLYSSQLRIKKNCKPSKNRISDRKAGVRLLYAETLMAC